MTIMPPLIMPTGAHGHPYAGEDESGLVELATQQEVLDGLDPYRPVTPATLPALLAEKVPHATEAHRGVIELATLQEALLGEDAVRAITPALLKAVAADAFAIAAFSSNTPLQTPAFQFTTATVTDIIVTAGDPADFDIVGGRPRTLRSGVYACVFTPMLNLANGYLQSYVDIAGQPRNEAGRGFAYNGQENPAYPVALALTVRRVAAGTEWKGEVYPSRTANLTAGRSFLLVRLGD